MIILERLAVSLILIVIGFFMFKWAFGKKFTTEALVLKPEQEEKQDATKQEDDRSGSDGASSTDRTGDRV